jgi:thymidylate synthase ThyX
MIEVFGKGGVKVKIVADSYNPYFNKRLTSYEVDYHRFFHSELLTHRCISRNSSSSRAIPTKTIANNTLENTAYPIYWGTNKSGMTAGDELPVDKIEDAREIWRELSEFSVVKTLELHELGLHKQHANRPLEPYQYIKVLITMTEDDNFFKLRNHKNAQPEFDELTKCILQAKRRSTPIILNDGDWHLPYIHRRWVAKKTKHGYTVDILVYTDADDNELSIENAITISASCSAQTSYRKHDTSIEKAEDIFEKLIYSDPSHDSPIEHQAMCFRGWGIQKPLTNIKFLPSTWQNGITHVDRLGNFWSANFNGFIQYRKMIGH